MPAASGLVDHYLCGQLVENTEAAKRAHLEVCPAVDRQGALFDAESAAERQRAPGAAWQPPERLRGRRRAA